MLQQMSFKRKEFKIGDKVVFHSDWARDKHQDCSEGVGVIHSFWTDGSIKGVNIKVVTWIKRGAAEQNDKIVTLYNDYPDTLELCKTPLETLEDLL